MKTAVVTGTNSGIGFATSLHLARNGYKVYAGMRNLSKSDDLQKSAKSEQLQIEIIEMDVCSQPSVAEAFDGILKNGPIDVLVNNAGIGGATPLEDTTEEEHKRIFDTNYFGTVRCIQAVLPKMRVRQSGTIVNISSIVGLLAVPNQIAYSASKWAMECLGEALAHEVYRFGIRVVNIEPGVFMTSIFDNSQPATRYDKQSAYQKVMQRNGKFYSSGFKRDANPAKVAEVILKAIQSDKYQLRWPVGVDALGISSGRPKISDEEWVSMGREMSDEEYSENFLAYFGFEI